MEIRHIEEFPVATSEEQIEVECLEFNSHSELQNPSYLFKNAAPNYT